MPMGNLEIAPNPENARNMHTAGRMHSICLLLQSHVTQIYASLISAHLDHKPTSEKNVLGHGSGPDFRLDHTKPSWNPNL